LHEISHRLGHITVCQRRIANSCDKEGLLIRGMKDIANSGASLTASSYPSVEMLIRLKKKSC
ncbi:hypothetical protein Tco_0582319, partial [Tanacetum coccineum]